MSTILATMTGALGALLAVLLATFPVVYKRYRQAEQAHETIVDRSFDTERIIEMLKRQYEDDHRAAEVARNHARQRKETNVTLINAFESIQRSKPQQEAAGSILETDDEASNV